jgi:HEAT repeat protein
MGNGENAAVVKLRSSGGPSPRQTLKASPASIRYFLGILTRDASDKDIGERFLRVREAKAQADTKYLVEALRDPDNRSAAAEYLADLGAIEAIPPLMRLLDVADPYVRAAAAQALGRLGAWEALPRLREIAADDQDFVRSWAIGAIGDIGDPEDVDLLISLLADPSMRVRAAAALALGLFRDPKAAEPLRAARARLRRSPLEWCLYRRLYKRAAKASCV